VILNIAQKFEMLLHVFRKPNVKYFLKIYLDCWKVCIALCKMPFLQISNQLSAIYKHSVSGKLFVVHIYEYL